MYECMKSERQEQQQADGKLINQVLSANLDNKSVVGIMFVSFEYMTFAGVKKRLSHLMYKHRFEAISVFLIL